MYLQSNFQKKLKQRRYQKRGRINSMLIIWGITVLILMVFLFNPSGIVRLLYQKSTIKKMSNEIEQLKLKAELIEAKLDKVNNDEYLKKFLQDFCKFVPVESVPK
ncbi:MAG: hypothetical protein ABIK10_00835 [candidate division WOR-3 bacterium]